MPHRSDYAKHYADKDFMRFHCSDPPSTSATDRFRLITEGGKADARGLCSWEAIATASVPMLFQRMTNRGGKASLFREHLNSLLADGLLLGKSPPKIVVVKCAIKLIRITRLFTGKILAFLLRILPAVGRSS